MGDAPTPDKILRTGLAFWPSKTLLSAIVCRLSRPARYSARVFAIEPGHGTRYLAPQPELLVKNLDV